MKGSAKIAHNRVLVARIGWMRWYKGPQDGDQKPVGGGSFNDGDTGSEIFTFKEVNGHLYGYVQTPNSEINLSRIDPLIEAESDRLNGVTVIFVATDPKAPPGPDRQKIVGWYLDAAVLKTPAKHPAGTRDEEYVYNLQAPAAKAVLLPTRRRKHSIQRQSGSIGQANIWYPRDEDGRLRKATWLRDAITYIDSYAAENLLDNPEAEVADHVRTSFEDAAGFESDPRVRSAIEQYAMKFVERLYRREGWDVKDKSATAAFDFLCEKTGLSKRVEVKGTRTDGRQIVLTPNEVEQAEKHDVDLCIVHSIELSSEGTARKGKLLRYESWKPCDHTVRPVSYLCVLSPLRPIERS